VTISFNLPPGVAPATRVTAIQSAEREIGMPQGIRGSCSATAGLPGLPRQRAAPDRGRAYHRLHINRRAQYESYIHPITDLSTPPSAGVGALVALMLFHTDLW
jgi:multidrug efflux pump